jgi:adenylosuccinate synthase
VEGTQGFGLSILHSKDYPKVTSRDTTASGFASEAGISPFDIDEIVLTLRAFPIRVHGDSGPMPNEITWRELSSDLGIAPDGLIERTTVTGRPRRIARFHPEIVRKAIAINQPTQIVLNHLDYFTAQSYKENIIPWMALKDIEDMIGRTVDYLGLGPESLIKRTDPFLVRSC